MAAPLPPKVDKPVVAGCATKDQAMDELWEAATNVVKKSLTSTPAVRSHVKIAGPAKELKTPRNPMILRKIPPFCGNERFLKHASAYKTCFKKAVMACPRCELIEYCSEKCRLEHAESHAPFCTAKWACIHWNPVLKRPETAQDPSDKAIAPSPLWGNKCMINMLENEDGISYFRDINLLQPISGDLGNTIMTITSLPWGYKEQCEITLNDPNVTIVIRNALMLMIIFLYPDKYEAAKTVLKLWYCSSMKEKIWKKLKFELLPFIERAYAKKGKGKATSQVSQRWTKGTASLRLTLTRKQWKQMIELVTNGDNLSLKDALKARQLVIADPTKNYLRNKKVYEMPVPYRRAHVRYISTGMLVPFGEPLASYNMPNPTLFSSSGEYLNTADDDPLDSWILKDVLKAGERRFCHKNDLYAALGQHVGATLYEFCIRLSDCKHKVNFHLYSVELKKLDGTLGNNKEHHVNGLNFLQFGSYDHE